MGAPQQCVSLAQLDLMGDFFSGGASPSTFSTASMCSDSTSTDWRTSTCDSSGESLYGVSPCGRDEVGGNRCTGAETPNQLKRKRYSGPKNFDAKKSASPISHVTPRSDRKVRKSKQQSMSHPASIDWFFSTFLSTSTITDNERILLEELVPESVVDALSVDAAGETRLNKPQSICAGAYKPHNTWLDPAFEPRRRKSAPCRTWQFEADKHQTKLQATFIGCNSVADQDWGMLEAFEP